MRLIASRDLHWLAGLMEGEGHFGFHKDGCVRIEVSMTDKDVIDRVEDLLGFGNRYTNVLRSEKIIYKWASHKSVEAAGLMMTLLPLMGNRRSEKIKEILAYWKFKPKLNDRQKEGYALRDLKRKIRKLLNSADEGEV